ncbi:hypothetical protein [Paenibacillus albus]|uniref:Uncharacterized protein n=1 Tax=Paenibacillus albus TaxID=2495582 RepID=A0A3S9A3W7_9BACL|nr:hypothetical protein [Paenibacillus albus]AZN40427.1 hypothetical protein EJC50_12765 [Paenibacillus albus]
MRRNSMKMIIVGATAALVIMFGIDLASSGIERIYGPVSGGTGATAVNPQTSMTSKQLPADTYNTVTDQEQVQEQLPENQIYVVPERRTVADAQHGRTDEEVRRAYERKLQEELDKRLPGVPDLKSESTVNKVADGTAGVLQTMSSKGIRMVVSFFESVTD